METKAIEQLNQEQIYKDIFCEINNYLFDADLMRGKVGELYRNIRLEQIC